MKNIRDIQASSYRSIHNITLDTEVYEMLRNNLVDIIKGYIGITFMHISHEIGDSLYHSENITENNFYNHMFNHIYELEIFSDIKNEISQLRPKISRWKGGKDKRKYYESIQYAKKNMLFLVPDNIKELSWNKLFNVDNIGNLDIFVRHCALVIFEIIAHYLQVSVDNLVWEKMLLSKEEKVDETDIYQHAAIEQELTSYAIGKNMLSGLGEFMQASLHRKAETEENTTSDAYTESNNPNPLYDIPVSTDEELYQEMRKKCGLCLGNLNNKLDAMIDYMAGIQASQFSHDVMRSPFKGLCYEIWHASSLQLIYGLLFSTEYTSHKYIRIFGIALVIMSSNALALDLLVPYYLLFASLFTSQIIPIILVGVAVLGVNKIFFQSIEIITRYYMPRVYGPEKSEIPLVALERFEQQLKNIYGDRYDRHMVRTCLIRARTDRSPLKASTGCLPASSLKAPNTNVPTLPKRSSLPKVIIKRTSYTKS